MSNQPPAVLYHYCSMEAFFDILKSRRIWLSSLRQSNDFLEGKLIAHALDRFAIEDRLDEHDRHSLRGAFGAVESSFEGIALCLSSERDLLSQWRGYAADATGVSVGFSASYLAELGTKPADLPQFELVQIEYTKDENDSELIRPVYEIAKKLLAEGVFRSEPVDYDGMWREALFFEELKKLKRHIFRRKSSAFVEEKEWRLLAHASNLMSIERAREDCNFRMSGGRLIPYLAYDLVPLEGFAAIEEIIVGPKNPNALEIIRRYASSAGFDKVRVQLSDASYR